MNKSLIAFTTMSIIFITGCSPLDREANLVPLNEEAKMETEGGGYYELISVKMSDESKFSREEWNKILKQIEKGEVILQDE